MFQTYFKAFQIGFIAGMRAMSAPALLSHKLTQSSSVKTAQNAIQYLAKPAVSNGLKVLAVGEMIADKLPKAPNRTSPPQFAARIASGATCGAFLSEAEGKPAPFGAIVGGIGAAAGTLLFFRFRTWLDHDLGFPDAVGALAEDALVIGIGWQIADGIEPVQKRV